MSWLLVVLLVPPPVAAAVSLAGRPRLAGLVSCVAGVAVFGLSVAVAWKVRNGAELAIAHSWLRFDSLGGVFLLATGLLYALGTIFSIGYLRADARRPDFVPFARRYFAYFNLFAWSMLLVPEASDFATLWIAVELTTIVSALLVAVDRTDAALEAAWKYVLIASAGLGIALIGVILLYAAGSDLLGAAYLPRYGSYLGVATHLPSAPVRLAFLLAAVGFGTKAGFFPMHTWLPDAHSEAPSPVSALLSGALLANAFYAILRFYQVTALAGGSAFPRRVLLVLGVASLLLAAFSVLSQRNYKRLLAYSSIEHMSVIALGVGFGAPLAIAGALLHVVNHAAAKGLAFFGAGSILRRFDTKEIDEVSAAGLRLPWSGPLFLAAVLALSGLPLSGIFRSELQVVAGGLSSSAYVSAAFLIVLVNLAFFGVVWYLGRMVLSQPAGEGRERGETSYWMVAAMLGCTLVVVGLGLHLPGDFSQLLHDAASRLTNPR
jgi:hydrogenase-4 component F